MSAIPLAQLSVPDSSGNKTKTRPQRERRKSLSLARSPSIITHSALAISPNRELHDPLLARSRSNIAADETAIASRLDDIKEASFDDSSLSREPLHQHGGSELRKSEDGDAETEMNLLQGEFGGGTTWEEGFEKPDRAEMMAMILSGTLVGVLAVAAGLATIYDWVL